MSLSQEQAHFAESGVPRLDIDPFSNEFLTTPYPYHEQIRDAGPIVWLDQYKIWATARHEQVKSILPDWEMFSSAAGAGLANFHTEKPFRPPSLLLEADPPDHTKARNVVARALSPKVIQRMRTEFEERAIELIEQLIEKRDIDGAKDLAERYPVRVFGDAVGIAADERENLLLYGDMVFNSFGAHNALFQKSVARYEPVSNWIMDRCRREQLQSGGLGEMIFQAADNGEVTDGEALMLVRSFLSAGIDSTVLALGNALYCMAMFPDQYEKLVTSPQLARPAFEEVLRFESPIQIIFRTTSRPMEFAGVRMGAHEKVLLLLAGANRDERYWKSPNVFDIERKAASHFTFGSGIHGCVGQVVARLEGEIILTTLANKVKRIEMAGDPVRRLNNALRGFGSLPIRLIPR